MKIERIPEYLLRWGVTLIGIVLPILLIQQAGYGNYGKIALVVMVSGLFAATLMLREKIWIAVPIFAGLTGTIPALGIPLMIRDFVIGTVVLAFIALKAFKVVNRKAPWDICSTLMLIMLLYLVGAWIRNPVGVSSLDSDRVGGKPYYNVFVSALAYWVLSQSSLRPESANRLTIAMTAARCLDGVLAKIIFTFPSVSWFFQDYYVSPYFSWAFTPDEPNLAPDVELEAREGYLAAIGMPLLLCLSSYMRPLAMMNILRIWRPVLLGIGLVTVVLSGFRSHLVNVACLFLFSSYYWRGGREVWKVISAGLVCAAFAILGNGVVFDLPQSAQRTLSFLPGNWDRRAEADAEDSVAWRVAMWKEMLTTDHYITNHMFGDGFGLKKRDLEIIAYLSVHSNGEMQGQESTMITGTVHSGPVSAIRDVGYVGLFLTILLQIAMMRYAWKLLWRAKGTPFQVFAFYICATALIDPLFFHFVYGAFENAIPDGLMSLGLLRVLQNSLDDYEARITEDQLLQNALAADPEEAQEEPAYLTH